MQLQLVCCALAVEIGCLLISGAGQIESEQSIYVDYKLRVVANEIRLIYRNVRDIGSMIN